MGPLGGFQGFRRDPACGVRRITSVWHQWSESRDCDLSRLPFAMMQWKPSRPHAPAALQSPRAASSCIVHGGEAISPHGQPVVVMDDEASQMHSTAETHGVDAETWYWTLATPSQLMLCWRK